MKLSQGMFALALGIGCAWGQTSAQKAGSPPRRQIDIGAAEAPLSDGERTDLDAAVKKHDYAAEKSVIDKALAEHPSSFELLVMAGRLAYLEKKPKDAADALAQADKIKAISEPDRLTLAIAYEFSGAPEQSRAELLKLVTLAPKNAQYEYLLGKMDRHNQHIEQASEDFRKAIALDPKFVKAYEDLGQTQEDLGHPEEARKTYETGAAINRKQANHWERSPLDLGVLLLKANDLDGAQKLFQEALQYNPAFAWGHYYMGQVFEKRERHDDAIAEFKEAVVDSPRLKEAWLALGREFTRQGDKVEADKSIAIFKKLEEQEKAAQN
jgi:tetratricopeptide (TPR) repeat protein